MDLLTIQLLCDWWLLVIISLINGSTICSRVNRAVIHLFQLPVFFSSLKLFLSNFFLVSKHPKVINVNLKAFRESRVFLFYPGCVGGDSSSEKTRRSSRLSVPETCGVRFGAELQFVWREDSSGASDDDEFVLVPVFKKAQLGLLTLTRRSKLQFCPERNWDGWLIMRHQMTTTGMSVGFFVSHKKTTNRIL